MRVKHDRVARGDLRCIGATTLNEYRLHIEKVRARDLWHLTSRISRKILAYTIGIFLDRMLVRAPLQFEGLITD